MTATHIHAQTAQNLRGGPNARLGLPVPRRHPSRPANGLWIGRRQSPAATLRRMSKVLAELQATAGQARSPVAASQQESGARVAPDHREAILGLLAGLAERGVSVSTAARSWYSPMKVLAHEPGYPAELNAAGLNAVLAEAEEGGLLTRETYRDEQRKARTRWTLTTAGLAFVGRRAAPVADALFVGDVAQQARAVEVPAEDEVAPVAADGGAIVRKEERKEVRNEDHAEPVLADSRDPLADCMRALELALGTEATVSRDAWLDAWVSMRGDGSASIEEFGAAGKELRGLGAVRMAGGLVWVA